MSFVGDTLGAVGRLVTAPVRTVFDGLGVVSNVAQLAVSASPVGMVASKLMTGSFTEHAATDLSDIGRHGGHMVAAGAQTAALAAAPFTGGASLVPGFAVAYAEQRLS